MWTGWFVTDFSFASLMLCVSKVFCSRRGLDLGLYALDRMHFVGGGGHSGLTCGSEWLEVEVRQSSRDLRRPPVGRDHLCSGLLLRPSVTVAPRWGGRRSSASFFIRRSSSNWVISSDTIKARHMYVLIKTLNNSKKMLLF